MQGTDNKAISEILDALARPQAAKTQVIAAWLQSNWVKKSASASRICQFKKSMKHPPLQTKGQTSKEGTRPFLGETRGCGKKEGIDCKIASPIDPLGSNFCIER